MAVHSLLAGRSRGKVFSVTEDEPLDKVIFLESKNIEQYLSFLKSKVDQAILRMHFLEGIEMTQIGKALNLSKQAVSKRKELAIQKLRRRFNGHPP